MARDIHEYATEIRKYLTDNYAVAAPRLNEAVDRHAFRIKEGAWYNRPADECGDDIAATERWGLK